MYIIQTPSHSIILMPTSSLHESFLGAVFSTPGINLNTNKLTLGSFLTVGLTEHLALGSTSIFIILKFLLYNDPIATGGREWWAVTASCNKMLVTHGMMLAPLIILFWSHSSASNRKAEAINYILLHEHGICAKSPSKMWKNPIWIMVLHSGLNRTLAI